MLHSITPMVLTFNEVSNIKRTVEKLRWATRILIVDSGSTDGTLEILAGYPQAEVIHRPFDNFADQCNFGLAQLRTDWVLSLDADYELSDELVRELRELDGIDEVGGYRTNFVYCIYGRPLRGTVYPPRTVLYRVKGARYVNEGHGHRVQIAGQVRPLQSVIRHDDRKPLSRWLTAQQSYAQREADYLLGCQSTSLSSSDRLRRLMWPMPIFVFFYVLVVKGCLLDGWRGWFYALQRVLAEVMIALELIDRRLSGRVKS